MPMMTATAAMSAGLPVSCWNAQPEEDEVVAREQRVDELRNDRVLVADDTGKQRAAGAELLDQVVAHFFVDTAPADAALLDGSAQFAECGDRPSTGHRGILLGAMVRWCEGARVGARQVRECGTVPGAGGRRECGRAPRVREGVESA